MSENKHPSESNKLDTIHTTFKQAFEIKKNPFPWIKALSAGIAAALPVFIGLLFGNLAYGLLAGIGGFTYLYVFNQPYHQRAKKIFFVMVGLALSVVDGNHRGQCFFYIWCFKDYRSFGGILRFELCACDRHAH
ncbi:hypothetical protein [Peribacillus sp. NPDC096448]|uniref:hypothetical protein n=1 Tax=Peribacillus sp. NPDC096448 TaxID=3364395 RepID=UPI003824B9F0